MLLNMERNKVHYKHLIPFFYRKGKNGIQVANKMAHKRCSWNYTSLSTAYLWVISSMFIHMYFLYILYIYISFSVFLICFCILVFSTEIFFFLISRVLYAAYVRILLIMTMIVYDHSYQFEIILSFYKDILFFVFFYMITIYVNILLVICIFTCVCLYRFICMYIYIYIYTFICIFTYLYMYIYLFLYMSSLIISIYKFVTFTLLTGDHSDFCFKIHRFNWLNDNVLVCFLN